jgi:hypothetical protein
MAQDRNQEQDWHDADAVVEAEEGTETDTLAAAGERPRDELLDISQGGDDSIAGTAEAAAWTPGAQVPPGKGTQVPSPHAPAGEDGVAGHGP